MNYDDVFVVRTQNVEQIALVLDFFDKFTHLGAVPCWQAGLCPCGSKTKGGWCPEVLNACGELPRRWTPWPLSPDSDIEERWILVNEADDSEEHPSGAKYITAQEALNAADQFNTHTGGIA